MHGKVSPEVIVNGFSVGNISYITLDQPINGHHYFTVACPLTESLNTMFDLGGRYIGKEITISLNPGYNRIPGSMKFKGIVTNVRLSKHESALMQLLIQGYSPTRLLDDGPHYQSWKDQTLAGVVDEVTGKYDITTSNDITYAEPLPYISQYRETSFEFITRKMATFGQWCYYDGEKLVLGTPMDGPDTTLTFGKDMTGLDVSADIVPADFKLLGYDYVQNEHFTAEGSAATVAAFDQLGNLTMDASSQVFKNKPLNVEPFYSPTKTRLEDHAKRRKSGQGAQFVNIFGQSAHLGLQLGQVIVVKASEHTLGFGVGASDYGRFRIVHLTHSVDPTGNYSNNFQAIPASLEMPPVEEKTIRPPIAETQPAEVMDNRDPDGLGRLQVQFPWQKENGQTTPWIRVSTAGAGGGHGIYFTPEIGDQVLVGFTWNSPDRPIVVGSLYNKATKHVGAADSDNNSKIIRTRSGNQIMLSDKGGEEGIVITNGTNVITLGLAGSTTITIETAGDLILKGKTVAITAETSFTLNSETSAMTSSAETNVSAGSDLNLDATANALLNAGTNVTVQAGGALAASGKSTAEVSSVTTTVNGETLVNVKGAVVKLN